MANFKAHDCCYKCLLPQKVCQPNSEGRNCFDKDLLGVFLVAMLTKYEIVRSSLPDIDWFFEAKNPTEEIELRKRMLEVDHDLLGTETPKGVILFLSFCTKFKDQSEAKE
jgi:hypothetical protein